MTHRERCRRLPVFFVAATVALAGISVPLAGAQEYPLLVEADMGNPLFLQLVESIRVPASDTDPVPLMLVRYVPESEEALVTIAGTFGLPPATLATLNAIDDPFVHVSGEILIPNRAGIFISNGRRTGVVASIENRLDRERGREIVVVRDGTPQTVRFFSGEALQSTEIIDLYRATLLHPVTGAALSSPFGFRVHPVTGERRYHTGIDLAAPHRTPVYAAGWGIVTRIDRDQILGLSITVAHSDRLSTRYAHLGEHLVTVGDAVSGDSIVGRIGSTGYSTGPHLHFEVIVDGTPVDPLHFLSVEDGR